MENPSDLVLNEFNSYSPRKALKIDILSGGASGKLIHRIFTPSETYIGIYNSDIAENAAFIGFSEVFKSLGLNVPDVYHVSKNKRTYIISDFGDLTLHRYLIEPENKFSRMIMNKSAIENLVKFQIPGCDKIDYSLCYQTSSFDISQIQFDEEKFIKHYLPLNKKKIDEHIIRHSFQTVNKSVLSGNAFFFMYRDFQPRNILVYKGRLHFIDYQSGRKGPLLYDLASYLYSGSIFLTEAERDELKNFYLNELIKYKIEINNFEEKWNYIVFIRLIQMLGSYAYSYEERKGRIFIDKIVSGIGKLKTLIDKFQDYEIKNFLESLEY